MVRVWCVEVVNLFGVTERTVYDSAATADAYATAQLKFGYKVFVWEL